MSWHFIDTHCHFDFPPFQNDEAHSIVRAAEAGVERIIVPAIGSHYFDRVMALARTWPALYSALGLHPIVIEENTPDCPDTPEQWLAPRPEKLVAYRQIGSPYCRDNPHFAWP